MEQTTLDHLQGLSVVPISMHSMVRGVLAQPANKSRAAHPNLLHDHTSR